MNWADIRMVEVSRPNKEYLDNILDEFKEVFDSSIEKIITEKRNIRLKDEAKPIFINPKQVPYALKASVEQEIKRL